MMLRARMASVFAVAISDAAASGRSQPTMTTRHAVHDTASSNSTSGVAGSAKNQSRRADVGSNPTIATTTAAARRFGAILTPSATTPARDCNYGSESAHFTGVKSAVSGAGAAYFGSKPMQGWHWDDSIALGEHWLYCRYRVVAIVAGT